MIYFPSEILLEEMSTAVENRIVMCIELVCGVAINYK